MVAHNRDKGGKIVRHVIACSAVERQEACELRAVMQVAIADKKYNKLRIGGLRRGGEPPSMLRLSRRGNCRSRCRSGGLKLLLVLALQVDDLCAICPMESAKGDRKSANNRHEADLPSRSDHARTSIFFSSSLPPTSLSLASARLLQVRGGRISMSERIGESFQSGLAASPPHASPS